MYYKILKDKKVIDVLYDLRYVRFQERNSILITTKSKEKAMGVLSSDQSKIYHTNSMIEFPKDTQGKYLRDFINVEIQDIGRDEYNALYKALYENDDNNNHIPIPDESTEEEYIQDNSIELIRLNKINEMSRECNKMIESGVTITLSDGVEHHFELTVEDQLNIITLKGMVDQGMTEIPYHATNEVCKFYSSEDIMLLMNASSEWKIYHVSYFNSLKNYINSITELKELLSVDYGMEIPEKYQSDVLKALIQSK